MFVKDSRPLADARVRVSGTDAEELATDVEGRVAVDLAEGAQEVQINDGSGWKRRTVTADPRSSLIVVDMDNRTDAFNQHSTEAQLALSAADIQDRYDVAEVLGRGGMGVVIKAFDTLLERTVAIKVLNAQLRDNPEANQIFLREARALAGLSHPNLVSVHDVVAGDNQAAMIVEFVRGQSLEEVLDSRGAIPQKTVLQVGIRLCRAISYLHSQGIIHRDLKPANVMFESDGTLKLIDFGLARSLQAIAQRGTRVRGTPAYMAPEQVEGANLSEATDVYQIGVTLFEAAAGRLPFTSGDLAYAHAHTDPPRLDKLVPNVLPALAERVHGCLAKNPADRPPSASGLQQEFEALLAVVTSAKLSQPLITDSGIVRSPTAGDAPRQSSQFDDAHGSDPRRPAGEDSPLADDSSSASHKDSAPKRSITLAGIAALALAATALLGVWTLIQSTGRESTPAGTSRRDQPTTSSPSLNESTAPATEATNQPTSPPDLAPSRANRVASRRVMSAAVAARAAARTSAARAETDSGLAHPQPSAQPPPSNRHKSSPPASQLAPSPGPNSTPDDTQPSAPSTPAEPSSPDRVQQQQRPQSAQKHPSQPSEADSDASHAAPGRVDAKPTAASSEPDGSTSNSKPNTPDSDEEVRAQTVGTRSTKPAPRADSTHDTPQSTHSAPSIEPSQQPQKTESDNPEDTEPADSKPDEESQDDIPSAPVSF